MTASCQRSALIPDRGFSDVDAVVAALRAEGYVAERDLATAIFLALRMGKPIFLEGEPGVGKTEVAKADYEKEVQIVLRHVPEASEHFAAEIVRLVEALREEDLFKRPGVAETLDWTNALIALDASSWGCSSSATSSGRSGPRCRNWRSRTTKAAAIVRRTGAAPLA